MLKRLAAGSLLLITVLADGGNAAVVTTGGGRVLQVFNVSDTADSIFSATTTTAFFQIPGAQRSVVVPAGKTRLVTVTFTAESTCTDVPGLAPGVGWCSVRIVATKSGSPPVIFNPNATSDGVFDYNMAGGNPDDYGPHTVTQSTRLAAGTWIVRAQRAIVVASGGGTAFLLDDWNLNILVAE